LQNVPDQSARNITGGAWLLADMTLNIWALTIVKALGLGYPAVQIVFLRALVGLMLMVPWAMKSRREFAKMDRLPLHALRLMFSTVALMASFFAVSRLPFALFTTISFTRPVLTMIMAVIFLRETVSGRRWAAAAVAFIGVIIAVEPGEITLTWGLPAMGFAVFFGTASIILTRQLSETPTVVMMTFYTGGLTVMTAPFIINNWVPIPTEHLLPLLAIGLFAQSAQFCFLKAHGSAEAGFLSVLGYLSLLLTTGVGFFVFGEVPSVALVVGAVLIVGAAAATTFGKKG
jgi:S-adenosylmethionine uptake transporter